MEHTKSLRSRFPVVKISLARKNDYIDTTIDISHTYDGKRKKSTTQGNESKLSQKRNKTSVNATDIDKSLIKIPHSKINKKRAISYPEIILEILINDDLFLVDAYYFKNMRSFIFEQIE